MKITEKQQAELKEILGEDLNECNLNNLIRLAKRGTNDLEANIKEIINDYLSYNLELIIYRRNDDKISGIDLRLEGCLISSAE